MSRRLLPLTGRARCFGDDIDSDAILPAARRYGSTDLAQLRRYLFETRAPGFAGSVREGDILVAGRNFGAGSISDLPVTAVLSAGIRAVVAVSFARAYFRNAVNNGLVALCAASTGDIRDGETLTLLDAPLGAIELRTDRLRMTCEPLGPFVRSLLDAGGMVPYLRAHGGFGPQLPGEKN